MTKRIKLEDIAKELNTTKVTISKALRDHPDISDERKKEIKAKAEELGYIPNIAARNLSARKTNTIGVIVPVISNYFFANVIESIYKEAFKSNYEIILAVSQESRDIEKKHIESMLSMNVDSIIISVVENSDNIEILEKVKQLKVPTIFFDRTLKVEGFSKVTSDNRKGAYLATKQALGCGYKNIFHFGGKDNSNIALERYEGFKKAMSEYNINNIESLRIPVGYSQEEGYQAFKDLISKNNIPECIFTVTFPVALGIYNAAKEAGIDIPDQMDLVSFGTSEINEYLNPRISCIDPDPIELGKITFEIALKKIEGGADSVFKKKITPRYTKFDTC